MWKMIPKCLIQRREDQVCGVDVAAADVYV